MMQQSTYRSDIILITSSLNTSLADILTDRLKTTRFERLVVSILNLPIYMYYTNIVFLRLCCSAKSGSVMDGCRGPWHQPLKDSSLCEALKDSSLCEALKDSSLYEALKDSSLCQSLKDLHHLIS